MRALELRGVKYFVVGGSGGAHNAVTATRDGDARAGEDMDVDVDLDVDVGNKKGNEEKKEKERGVIMDMIREKFTMPAGLKVPSFFCLPSPSSPPISLCFSTSLRGFSLPPLLPVPLRFPFLFHLRFSFPFRTPFHLHAEFSMH